MSSRSQSACHGCTSLHARIAHHTIGNEHHCVKFMAQVVQQVPCSIMFILLLQSRTFLGKYTEVVSTTSDLCPCNTSDVLHISPQANVSTVPPSLLFHNTCWHIVMSSASMDPSSNFCEHQPLQTAYDELRQTSRYVRTEFMIVASDL